MKKIITANFPGWLSSKEPVCQCRRLRFDPCVKKILWRRKWQPTLVFLPGKSHGQRSLVGYTPWGHKRVRHDLVTKRQQCLEYIHNPKHLSLSSAPASLVPFHPYSYSPLSVYNTLYIIPLFITIYVPYK